MISNASKELGPLAGRGVDGKGYSVGLGVEQKV
jgi:hypothetical protein